MGLNPPIQNMSQFAILVPARLESTRFPEKLLHLIRGKPLLLWVAERIVSEVPEIPLWFAVDSEKLRSLLEDNGFKSVMTDPNHMSGTDRLAEANETVGADYVINVQGDEPLVSAGQIRALAELVQGECPMGTLGIRFKRAEDFLNPNQVKVVTDSSDRALYFSRSPIPYPRDEGTSLGDEWVAQNSVYRHLGLYSYQKDFLKAFSEMPLGHLEQIEKLEQLRVLEAGYDIAVGYTEEASIGIDALADVAEFEAYLSK